MSIFSKIWSAGEKLLASDLNTNFENVVKTVFTAGEDIAQNDSVYISAADTVKKLLPTGLNTPISVTTNPSNVQNVKTVELSNGVYLHVTGGVANQNTSLYAQVRTINAAETDFTNGTEQTIDSTGFVYKFDVALIGTNKVLVTWQVNNGGATREIKAVALTISGTTIIMGTAVTIESTSSSGNNSEMAVSKIDTDKALILYQRNSDQNIMCQVLTVSGTTITTNTAVVIKAQGNILRTIASTQLETNSVLVVYSASSNLFARTISVSGTTPTVNSEQTLVASSSTTYTVDLRTISTTKVLMLYSDNDNSVNDQATHLTISGSTITKGSNLALGSNRNTDFYFGAYIISTKFALVSKMSGSTSLITYLLDISGVTPTSVASDSQGTSFNSRLSATVVKIKPWVYLSQGGESSNGDYIYTLTNGNNNARIGIAESAIANGVTGNILRRYMPNDNLTGLTAGAFVYIDDNAQPTTTSSLSSPILGLALSSTDILMQ